MVTNYPQQLTAASTQEHGDQDDGLITRALGYVSQALCGLHGHDSVLHFEENRVLLRCTSCGYDSPGWDVGHRRPRVRYATSDERVALRPVLRKTA